MVENFAGFEGVRKTFLQSGRSAGRIRYQQHFCPCLFAVGVLRDYGELVRCFSSHLAENG